MNEQEIIQDYKNGMTIAEIARKTMLLTAQLVDTLNHLTSQPTKL